MTESDGKAGFHIDEWIPLVGISRATLYNLTPECQPRHLRMGVRIIITEAPRAWLARMQALGGIRTKRQASKPLAA